MSLQEDVALLRDAAIQAGRLIVSQRQQGLKIWSKEGGSPVTEITVAGNLIDIYARVVPGSDLEFRGATNAPSLLVDGMAIAGK